MEGFDPNVPTRRAFTDNLTSFPIPDDADKKFAELASSLQALLRALAYHEAMAPNIDQPFMKPAAYKNKVCFVWDLIGRTLGMLFGVDPHKPKANKESSEDVHGRSLFGHELIFDTTGKLEMMCPDGRGMNVQFGPEVGRLANNVGE